MKKEMKKPYVPPVCMCTRVVLESPICNSSIQIATQDGAHGISDQKINQGFESANDFVSNGETWDRG